MAGPATMGNDHKEGAPTVVLQDAYTWVSMPYDPPPTASTPGGSARTTKVLAVACMAGTLGLSLQPNGSGEQQLVSGSSIEVAVGVQGFLVRGVGGAATYQYIAQLK